MKNEDKDADEKPLSERKKQQIRDGFNIFTTPATADDLAFIAREFVLCTLPHSDPGEVPLWKRTNGSLTLGIQAGMNVKTGKSYGYPFGVIPRLLLVWMVTEVLRTKSRRLELGNYLSDFLERIGLSSSTGRGVRGDARRVREQMERLFRATISFDYSSQDGGLNNKAWLDMKVAPRGSLWWSDKSAEQGELWGSWVEVGEEFYKAVMANPYPLDVRVLRHIKNSALGIDLYTILNREAYRANKEGKPRFLAWEWLYVQTGNEYNNATALSDFRRYALEQIKQILDVHSGLIVSVQKGRKGQKSGLIISNLSRPSIVPEAVTASPPPPSLTEARRTARLTMTKPSPATEPPLLKPRTIEDFRLLFPRIDPYECKRVFDEWLAKKSEADQPRYYDRAFLAFARRWVLKGNPPA